MKKDNPFDGEVDHPTKSIQEETKDKPESESINDYFSIPSNWSENVDESKRKKPAQQHNSNSFHNMFFS